MYPSTPPSSNGLWLGELTSSARSLIILVSKFRLNLSWFWTCTNLLSCTISFGSKLHSSGVHYVNILDSASLFWTSWEFILVLLFHSPEKTMITWSLSPSHCCSSFNKSYFNLHQQTPRDFRVINSVVTSHVKVICWLQSSLFLFLLSASEIRKSRIFVLFSIFIIPNTYLLFFFFFFVIITEHCTYITLSLKYS